MSSSEDLFDFTTEPPPKKQKLDHPTSTPTQTEELSEFHKALVLLGSGENSDTITKPNEEPDDLSSRDITKEEITDISGDSLTVPNEITEPDSSLPSTSIMKLSVNRSLNDEER